MSESESERLARVTGVTEAEAERALNAPPVPSGELRRPAPDLDPPGPVLDPLDMLYAKWAAYSIPPDEEEAET